LARCFTLKSGRRLYYRNAMKNEPQIELTPYQRFIERLMQAFIVITLLGIFLKVLVI
jgi:hypothetical protein